MVCLRFSQVLSGATAKSGIVVSDKPLTLIFKKSLQPIFKAC